MTRERAHLDVFRCLVLAAAVTATLASRADAQIVDDGPIVIGEQTKPDKFHINRPTVALELDSVYRQDRNTSNSETNNFKEGFFSEALDLQTTGHFFSPAFFDFSAKGDFGLTQTLTNVNDEKENHTGELLRWDLLGTFRRDSKTPFSLFSQRENQWLHREFGPSLETVTDNNGARLDIRWPKAPTRFEVAHSETTQSGIDEIDDFNYTRDRFSGYTVYRPDDRNTLTGNYQFNRINQDGSFDAQYDTHELTLNQEHLFGARNRHTLNSSFDYRIQTGDLELQSVRFAERMRLRHTDKFETFYDYRLEHYDYPENERLRNYGQAGFLHRLYESLTTVGSTSLSYTNEDPVEFNSLEWENNLNFAYRKKVPLGNLLADLGLRRNVQDNSERGDETQITDQPAAFSDPLPIILPGPNVDTTGLVITDPTGLLIFEEGIDYTVSRFSDRVEINRVVGGRIPNLSPVLLDYGLLPTAGNTTTTDNFTLHLRYEFDRTFLRGLGLYGRYSVQDQSIDTDRPQDFVLNRYTDWLYGVDYRIGPWTFGVEEQLHNSDISPYDAQRAYARYLRRYGDLIASANAAYIYINHTDDGNRTELFTLSGQLRYAITRRMFIAGTVLYRDQTDTAGSDVNGFEQMIELQWNHRQTTVYLQARNSMLDTENDSDSFQFFQLGIRREF